MRMTPVRISAFWRIWQAVSVSVVVAVALAFAGRGFPMLDPCKTCEMTPWPDLCRLINWCWW